MKIIDLNSEQGNVFFIFSLIKEEMERLGYTKEIISTTIENYQTMTYDQIIEEIEINFGDELKFIKL